MFLPVPMLFFLVIEICSGEKSIREVGLLRNIVLEQWIASNELYASTTGKVCGSFFSCIPFGSQSSLGFDLSILGRPEGRNPRSLSSSLSVFTDANCRNETLYYVQYVDIVMESRSELKDDLTVLHGAYSAFGGILSKNAQDDGITCIPPVEPGARFNTKQHKCVDKSGEPVLEPSNDIGDRIVMELLMNSTGITLDGVFAARTDGENHCNQSYYGPGDVNWFLITVICILSVLSLAIIISVWMLVRSSRAAAKRDSLLSKGVALPY